MEANQLVRETNPGVLEKRMRGARRGSLATLVSMSTKMHRSATPPRMDPQTLGSTQGNWLPVGGGVRIINRGGMGRRTSEGETNEERSDGRDEGDGSEVIDPLDLADDITRTATAHEIVGFRLISAEKREDVRDVDLPGDDTKVDEADGDLDQESPPPADGISQESSQRSSDGSSECTGRIRLVSRVYHHSIGTTH